MVLQRKKLCDTKAEALTETIADPDRQVVVTLVSNFLEFFPFSSCLTSLTYNFQNIRRHFSR